MDNEFSELLEVTQRKPVIKRIAVISYNNIQKFHAALQDSVSNLQEEGFTVDIKFSTSNTFSAIVLGIQYEEIK